jgi:hypothetical protein
MLTFDSWRSRVSCPYTGWLGGSCLGLWVGLCGPQWAEERVP